ncbi:MAG: hypothetical protein EHM20_10045, partial [Alphaproteobacteria bacterium]
LIEGSDQVILRRLQKLYHHGYLDRPISQIVFSNPLLGPKKMVYGLGDKGADLLSETYGIDRGNIAWQEKNREVSERYIQHTLMISDFRACLTLALNKKPEARLQWLNDDGSEIKQEVYFMEEGKRKRLPIIPDGFFQIEDPEGKMRFFLEADRSTMTNARFLNKMKAYWLWWKQGGQKSMGIENFRVLSITKTKNRMENLIEVSKRVDDNYKSSYMFWFTSIDNYQLSQPENILEDIWLTSKDNIKHNFFE